MSEIGEGEFQRQGEALLQIVKEGPKLKDIANEEGRQNTICLKSVKGKRKERVCEEGRTVKKTLEFIDRIIQEATKSGDSKVAEQAVLLKKNLIFIGEKELGEAISAMSSRLLNKARKGRPVVVFFGGVRSERYIALRVLEEIDKMVGEDEDLRQKIHLSGSFQKTAEFARRENWNCLVAVCDDFIVSGARIRRFAGEIFNKLIAEGATPEQASKIVEANVVAINGVLSRGLSVGIENTTTERPLRVFSYYFAPEYFNNEGKWAVFPGASITGSHTSVDYGFEAVIREWGEKFPDLELPPLYEIRRPYEFKSDGREYRDHELQNKWERLSEAYSL